MLERRRLEVRGTVQGVGFRPYVFRLAEEMALAGWVANSAQGASIEMEADPGTLERFRQRLQEELPPHAAIRDMTENTISPLREDGFRIVQSNGNGAKVAQVLPDLAICPECLRELYNPADPRYRYPFINCTHCGPRYSILLALPYDRPNTTMQGFPLCPHCQAEYDDPRNRRFHAQPVACPVCGPHLTLRDGSGDAIAEREDALLRAEEALRAGKVVALKGIGGFQLLADARNEEAVLHLRQIKGRDAKPFAVLFPTLIDIEAVCAVEEEERALLTSAAAPIVLLRRRLQMPEEMQIAPSVAPENPNLGVFLAYSPLHHLLLGDLGFPLIATSANLSGEPICIELQEVLERLAGVELILDHNRPIARPLDDSVVAVALGKPMILRRARGYAPQPVAQMNHAASIVATGSQQKNTVALLHHGDLILSQHLGDMDSPSSVDLMAHSLTDLQGIYGATPTTVGCDLHPDYASTRLAENIGLPLRPVQHHRAHLLSCMVEHGLQPPVLGVIWDGIGYGDDGSIWGSEFFRVDTLMGDPNRAMRRVAHLRTFPLPGGGSAAREPRRALLGLLHALYGDHAPLARLSFAPEELRLLNSALRVGVNIPMTSSMGRLFDAVAALLGLRQRNAFEGDAAMALEFAAREAADEQGHYPLPLVGESAALPGEPSILDTKPMLDAMLAELPAPGLPIPRGVVARMAARFHNTLAAMVVEVARAEEVKTIALSGGCFQNRLLLERTVSSLRQAGFAPCWQQRIPPNDGGIAAGQVYGASLFETHVRKEHNDVSRSTGSSIVN